MFYHVTFHSERDLQRYHFRGQRVQPTRCIASKKKESFRTKRQKSTREITVPDLKPPYPSVLGTRQSSPLPNTKKEKQKKARSGN
jgi:hypothetical protein